MSGGGVLEEKGDTSGYGNQDEGSELMKLSGFLSGLLDSEMDYL